MMTIDEAIAYERQQEKDKRNEYYTFGIQKSKECAEECKQIAEWLEKLKYIESIAKHFIVAFLEVKREEYRKMN